MTLSRRAFLAATAATPLALAAAPKALPVGLELYSVRNELKADPKGTVRAVAKLGYECVEFFAPYYDWTPETAKDMRKLLDDTGMRCYSTHNGPKSFTADGMAHAIELNNILGSKYIVLASAGRANTVDAWKKVAETLNQGADGMKSAGLKPGYHNHQLEFKPLPDNGPRPMEILAANTGKDVMLQLDVGTCVEVGVDPVGWIERNPGRIRSLHLKNWNPEKKYQSLFGEGDIPWLKILAAARKTGGVEFVLIEQEGSEFPALETADRCLKSYRKLTA